MWISHFSTRCAGLERGEVGVGLFDGFGVRLPLLMLGERSVDAGRAWVFPLRFAFACGDVPEPASLSTPPSSEAYSGIFARFSAVGD
jgi:hypothetical protein